MLKALTENWMLKLLSLVFALILWFFVIGERRVEIGYTVPLELKDIPPDMMIANEVPSLVDVRLSGPRTMLMNLSPSDISISVDLSDLKPGLTSFKRLEERLDIPSGLKVTRLSPSFVDVRLDRVITRTVQVEAVFTGTPAKGYALGSVRIKPSRVEVEGAESELKDVNEVPTEPVDIDGVKESFALIVPLDYQGKYSHLKEDQTVELRVEIIAPPQPPDGHQNNEGNT